MRDKISKIKLKLEYKDSQFKAYMVKYLRTSKRIDRDLALQFQHESTGLKESLAILETN